MLQNTTICNTSTKQTNEVIIMQRWVTLDNDVKAIIDTQNRDKLLSSNYVMASIGGRPMQPLRKDRIKKK